MTPRWRHVDVDGIDQGMLDIAVPHNRRIGRSMVDVFELTLKGIGAALRREPAHHTLVAINTREQSQDIGRLACTYVIVKVMPHAIEENAHAWVSSGRLP